MSSSSSQKKTDILKEPRLPTISIDLGSSGCSVVVSRFAPENTAVSNLAAFTKTVDLTQSKETPRPLNDCLMYFPDGEMEVPFVIMRHSKKLDKVASSSSTLLLTEMEKTGSGGCLGLDGKPVQFINSERKMKIPGHGDVKLVDQKDRSRIRRVNNVKAPLYKWFNDNSVKAPFHDGHSAHAMLTKLRDVQLQTSDIRASKGNISSSSGSQDISPFSSTKKKAVLIWAGLYRDFILRAANLLLEIDNLGQEALGGKDKYLQAIKVSVCLPAEGETKFPWQLTSFIFEAIELATTGFTELFKPLADIRSRFEADVCGKNGKIFAKKGSSRILICSESRAVMQYLFTQRIKDEVRNQKGWDSFPDQICAMIIDPGHGTTDVSIVILDKATLTVVKHARADFGEAVGGKDVDDHFESLVVKPFLNGIRDLLKKEYPDDDFEDFNLEDFKIDKGEELVKEWQEIKAGWKGETSSELNGSGTATLSFNLFKQYIQNRVPAFNKFDLARIQGLERVKKGEEIKNIMKKDGVGNLIPDCVSALGEDIKLEWQLLKACFDKMIVPLRKKIDEACSHPLLDESHKVHLLCLAGGASKSDHVRKELHEIVKAKCAAPNMPTGINLSDQKNVSELPCLGALIDAWLRPDDVEAVRSSIAYYRWVATNLRGKDLAESLKTELRTRDDQIVKNTVDTFFKDLDEYISKNPFVDEIWIAVPMTSKGKLYCPTVDIPRYVLGSPDYTVSGKGEIYVGELEIPTEPDEWIGGKRIIHQRFLVLPPNGGVRKVKRALQLKPNDPVLKPTSEKANVLRLTLNMSGHFKSSLLDLSTGATSGESWSISNIRRTSAPLSGRKRPRDGDETETEDEIVEEFDLDCSSDHRGIRKSLREPKSKCFNAGQRGFCSESAPSSLWWFRDSSTSSGWKSGSGAGPKYCASCHYKLAANESSASSSRRSPSSHDDKNETEDDTDLFIRAMEVCKK